MEKKIYRVNENGEGVAITLTEETIKKIQNRDKEYEYKSLFVEMNEEEQKEHIERIELVKDMSVDDYLKWINSDNDELARKINEGI